MCTHTQVPGAPRVEAAIDKFKAERAAAEELRTRRARRGRPGSAADMLRQRRRRGTAPARTNMRTEWAMSAPRGQSGPNDISDTRPAGRAELRGPRPPDPRFSIGSLGDEGSPVPDAPADPDWDSFTSSRQQVRRLSQPAVDGLPVVTNSDGGHDLFMSSRGPSTSQQAEPEPETEVGQLFDLDVADPSWETVNEALATMPAKLPAPGSQMVPAADGVWLDHATANSKAATAANETGGGWLAERSQHAGSSGGASEADNQGRAAGLAHWTVTEVGEWLATCAKMPRHVDEFARREIDGFMLSRIDQIDLADMEIGKSTLECNDLLSLRDQFLTSANGQMGGIGVRASADAYGAKNVFDGEDEAI